MRVFWGLVITFSTGLSFAQDTAKLNLDFETSNSKLIPYAWGYDMNNDSWIIRCDTSDYYSGKKSLYLESRPQSAKSGFTISNFIPPALFKGKRTLEVIAYIKSDSLARYPKIILSQQWTDGYKFLDAILSEKSEKPGWERYKIRTAIDSLTERILIGASFYKGKYRIDHFSINIDGKEINDIAPDTIALPGKINLDWLEANTYPIADKNKQFNRINGDIKNARVVALGEATHGTHEFFETKISLSKELINRYHFTVVAIESPMADVRSVNEYVLGGNGELVSIMAKSGLFINYQTEEVKEFIEWMRHENTKRPLRKKLYFEGIDIQIPYNAQANVERFLKTNNRELYNRFINIYQQLDSIYKVDRDGKSYRMNLFNQLKTFAREFELFKENSYQLTANQEVEWVAKNVNLLLETLRDYHYKDLDTYTVRDSAMAANVTWLSRYRSAKVILWAHNEHISTRYMATGYWLRKSLGKLYYTIGFATGNGEYGARSPMEWGVNQLEQPYKETYDYYFSQLTKPVFIFPMRKFSSNINLKSFAGLKFRFIGIQAEKRQFVYTGYDLGRKFDVLIFIRNSTPSRSL